MERPIGEREESAREPLAGGWATAGGGRGLFGGLRCGSRLQGSSADERNHTAMIE